MSELFKACKNGELKRVKELVESEVDVNIKNEYGSTALHMASANNYLAIVKYLVENGADVNAQDSDGLTALDCAVKSDYLDIVLYLTGRGALVGDDTMEYLKLNGHEIISYSDATDPKHYKSHPSGIECIDITRHMNFNLGNAIKYIWRNGLKESDNNVQDLKKAIWYLEDEIKRLSNENV